MGASVPIPVCELGKFGRRGFLHRDITGKNSDGEPRGPFDLEAASPAPEYPMLWGHDANREHQLIVYPDQQGISRKGHRERAAKLWREGASRLHFNLDFRINSQPLAACMTEKRSLGGRAWPNFLTEKKWEIPIVLWANTTLGLISFWWAGTRQQQGRSIFTITRLPRLLSIDVKNLNSEQLSSVNNFRGFS